MKMIAFYLGKNVDLLDLGCTLPKLNNICLHKFTNAKVYQFTEGEEDLFENVEKMFLVVLLSYLYEKRLLTSFFSKINKLMQINSWVWNLPTVTLLDVSTHAYRSLYALGLRFRNE